MPTHLFGLNVSGGHQAPPYAVAHKPPLHFEAAGAGALALHQPVQQRGLLPVLVLWLLLL